MPCGPPEHSADSSGTAIALAVPTLVSTVSAPRDCIETSTFCHPSREAVSVPQKVTISFLASPSSEVHLGGGSRAGHATVGPTLRRGAATLPLAKGRTGSGRGGEGRRSPAARAARYCARGGARALPPV
jgi:hypothetical protein